MSIAARGHGREAVYHLDELDADRAAADLTVHTDMTTGNGDIYSTTDARERDDLTDDTDPPTDIE